MKKSVIGSLSAIGGALIGIAVTGKKLNAQVKDREKMSQKHLALFEMMNRWVRIKQSGKSLADYLEREGYKEIAIYGMSYAGESLVNELEGSNVKVKYGIDKNADKIYEEFDVVTPDEHLEDVDAVVVTAITFFGEIEGMLCEKVDCPIISLEEILDEVEDGN